MVHTRPGTLLVHNRETTPRSYAKQQVKPLRQWLAAPPEPR